MKTAIFGLLTFLASASFGLLIGSGMFGGYAPFLGALVLGLSVLLLAIGFIIEKA